MEVTDVVQKKSKMFEDQQTRASCWEIAGDLDEQGNGIGKLTDVSACAGLASQQSNIFSSDTGYLEYNSPHDDSTAHDPGKP